MSITAAGFVDTFGLTVLLHRQRKILDDEPMVEIWKLFKDEKWQPAKRTTARALDILAGQNNGVRPELVGVWLEKVSAESVTEWRNDVDFAESNMRFHLPIVTNPLAFIHTDLLTGHLPVGQLTFIDVARPHCATNAGKLARYHMIVDVKRPDRLAEPPAMEA